MISTIRHFLTVLLAFAVISACGSGDQQNQQQKQQQAQQKQQARQDSIQQAKADSIARAKADSLAKAKKREQEQKQKEKEKLTLEDISFSANGAFSVQVEAWRSREKAEQQVSKWKKRGFSNAYVVKHGNEDTGNIWFRVRLGRVSTKAMADKLGKFIKQNYNEKYWITESKTEAS